MKRLASLAVAGAALSGAACGSSGYGVVDPLPPPPRCGDVAKTITASAVVRQGDDGSLRVELTLGKSTRADVSYPKEMPTGGMTGMVSATPGNDGSLVVVAAPIPPSTFTVHLQVDCPEGKANLVATIEDPSGAKAGTPLVVTLRDTY